LENAVRYVNDGLIHVAGKTAVPPLARPFAYGYDGPPARRFAYDGPANLFNRRLQPRTGPPQGARLPNAQETGLDYFGARYFSGAQGRFTSPDPLLNSGRPWNPQTWNRYAYTLNNPLKFSDPTGMYEWGACDGTQKECDNYKKQFRAGLDNLKRARDSFDKKSREYKRLDTAFKAYGKEGEKNGVSVGFGALAGSTAGTTTPLGDLKSFAVTLDPAKWSKDPTVASKFLASDVGHEGTHVDDLRQVFAGNELSPFSLEYRGYETSAFAFQGLFTPGPSMSTGTVFGGVTSRTLSYQPVDKVAETY
jgi:RHS repeat-associated protein